MSNFKIHNTPLLDYKICSEDYWDFHLALDGFSSLQLDGLSERCLSAYINISDMDCIDGENLVSKGEYVWDKAFNHGAIFENIGLTGVDNGLLHYDKDSITNDEFINIFFNSQISFSEDDYRLHMNKIYGNNKIYSYDAQIDNGIARLNGGFYQGFFKDAGTTYQILPHIIEDGWQVEMTLKKEEFERESELLRLNDHYPDNKGIFFFIGTRAENKWWSNYDTDLIPESSATDYLNLEILPFNYTIDPEVNTPYLNIDYIDYNKSKPDEFFIPSSLIDNGYEIYEFKGKVDPNNALEHFVHKDTVINPNGTITTKDGLNVRENDEVFIDTDNKFILFDRTKTGYTTCTWGDVNEDTQFTIQMTKPKTTENYFTLFNRTKDGYTTCTIDQLLPPKSEYDVNADIYRNALAFIINDEGKIGYRYCVKDCETNEPKVETEFSKCKLIDDGKWYTISVRFKIFESQDVENYECPNIKNNKNRKMRLLFYVNGYLKLVSQELPILDLKPLATSPSKQEGVPFNISIGGGTQGLCDTIGLDFKSTPKDVLFMEKNYAGSFIGYIKDFKFYTCPQDLVEVRKNLSVNRKTITI